MTLLKEIKKTQRNGKILYAYGFEEKILLKWRFYLKQYTNLMQPLSKSQWYFSQTWNNNKKSSSLYGTTEDPEKPKQF